MADPCTCPACGRSRLTHLGLLEALTLCGYGRTACMKCRLTDLPRNLPPDLPRLPTQQAPGNP